MFFIEKNVLHLHRFYLKTNYKKMKKLLIIAIAAFAFTACNSAATEETKEETSQETPVIEPATETPATETPATEVPATETPAATEAPAAN